MRRYILVETLISMVVNAAFSAGFAFLVFGGRAEIGPGDRAVWRRILRRRPS